MRKLWMAVAGAIVIAIAMAGVAVAVNTYDVDVAASKPGAKGSAAGPVPAQFRFGFEVGDTEGLRPQVIRQYRIAAEGLQSFPDARPTCTFAQANDTSVTDPDDLSRACRRAKVGQGAIDNDFGSPTDRTQKGDCDVQVTLFNISTGDPRFRQTVSQIRRRGGMAIRIDTYLNPDGSEDTSRCPIAVHEALAAPFYDVRIQGVSTAELRFAVPDTLAHPAGLDNSLTDVVATVQRKTGRVRVRGTRRQVGFYSLVGRKGAKRTVRVTFVDESGDRQTATAQD
jgi:hypothetical protein